MTDTKAGPPSYKGGMVSHPRTSVPEGRFGQPYGAAATALVATAFRGEIDIGPEDRIQELVLEEAYRIIKVRDGEPR